MSKQRNWYKTWKKDDSSRASKILEEAPEEKGTDDGDDGCNHIQ